MFKKPVASIQIWPITDPIFGKDLASDLQSALRGFGSQRPTFGWSSNGGSLRGGRQATDHISIEISKHKFRFSDERKERFLNIHLPEGIDPDEVLAIVRETAKEFSERSHRKAQPDLKVAIKFAEIKTPIDRPSIKIAAIEPR